MSRIYAQVDGEFAATCSDVTLCSNSKGFFQGLCEELLSKADGEWLKTLEGDDDSQKVGAVLQNEELMEYLECVWSRIQPLHRAKDARVAAERRREAASAQASGRSAQALALATQAVLRAPATGVDEAVDGGLSPALSLWLRAELLLKVGRPEAALADLRLALRERLPATMRAHYYWRLGHCYTGTGEPTRAKVSYELADRLLGSDAAARARLAQDTARLDFSSTPRRAPENSGIALTGGAKPNMPSLSKLLKITEEEDKGRFAVAGAPIRTGDVLLVDSPYAACLLPDFYGTHCLHCFRRFEESAAHAPVGCPRCSGVAFCSLQCRDDALATYHSYECQFLDLFIGSGMSILSHIALRMVTQAGLDTSLLIHAKHVSNTEKTLEGSVLNDIEGVAKKSKMKSRKDRLNRAKKGLKNEAAKNSQEQEEVNHDTMNWAEQLELKATQIYSLCTHSGVRAGGDFLKRVAMALFLTECLKKAYFFKSCQADKIESGCRAITELLVRNLQLLQFNAHEVYETVRGAHRFTGARAAYLAVAIYPAAALFNHECDPAVARYFEGRNIVLRALRPLSPGEVVSENYGPHFLMRTLKERQRSLASRYWFHCQCTACRENWPTLKQMTDDGPVYLRCANIDCSWKYRAHPQQMPSRCGKCSTPVDRALVSVHASAVVECIRQYKQGAQLMEEERAAEAITVMCAAIDEFHDLARPPQRDLHLAQEALRSCFASFGNVHVVKGEDQ